MTSMLRPVFSAIAAATLLAAALTATAGARPLVPAEQREMSYTGRLPVCDSPDVLGRISSRFANTESEYWQSGLQIVAFGEVAEIGFRSPGIDFIPRRYCIARATFNTGAVSTVSYAIGEDLGFLGFPGWGVDWCVDGLDRNRAASPSCKMKRP